MRGPAEKNGEFRHLSRPVSEMMRGMTKVAVALFTYCYIVLAAADATPEIGYRPKAGRHDHQSTERHASTG